MPIAQAFSLYNQIVVIAHELEATGNGLPPGIPGGGSSVSTHAYRLLFITVLLRPFGNLSLAWGMKHFQQTLGVNPILYLSALLNPYVAAGILLLVLSLFTRMALLSVADLSAVLPLTAIGYIVTTGLGKLFLNEQVSPAQWTGTALVFLGVALVSSGSLKTGLLHSNSSKQRAGGS